MKIARFVLLMGLAALLIFAHMFTLKANPPSQIVKANESSSPTFVYLPLAMNFDFGILSDGVFVFSARDKSANNQSFVYMMNGNGANLTQITMGLFPDLSPDGMKISYFLNEEIYIVNVDGSNPTNITNSPGWDVEPDWSPDGKLIAFRSGRDGNAEIYTMNPDGTNLVNLTNHAAWDGAPEWSPNGTKITFVSDRSGVRNVFVMDADGENVTQLTTFTSSSSFVDGPSWSPDGTKIAFSADLAGNDDDIWLMNSNGSGQSVFVSTPSSEVGPVWSPDGYFIAFSINNDANPDRRTYIASVENRFNPFQVFKGFVSNWINSGSN